MRHTTPWRSAPMTLLAAIFALASCAAPTPVGTEPAAVTPTPGAQPMAPAPAARAHDLDNDRIHDQLELAMGSDPTQAEPDADSDGLPDRIEAMLGTDPNKRDTDGDGFSDLFERFHDHHDVKHGHPATPREAGAYRIAYYEGAAPNRNQNELAAYLDSDEDGDGVHDGLQDSDGDGVPNALESAGYTYDAASGQFVAWDGDRSKRYYKTDPAQWSTDGDPYSDGMEATGINMDASVPFPGNHPLIPAYPDLQVSLTAYDVTLKQTVTSMEGGAIKNTWHQETVDETVTTSNTTSSLTAKASYENGVAGASVEGNVTHTDESVHTNRVTTDASSENSKAWQNTTETDTTQVADLKLTLQVKNIGTAPAKSVTPTINLRVGARSILTYTPSNAINSLGVGLSRGVSEMVYPNQTDATPLLLTATQLAALQQGLPIAAEVADVSAKVFDSLPPLSDPGASYNRQQLVGSGDWGDYRQRVEQVSFRLLTDLGNGQATQLRVYAAPEVIPGMASDPPRTTLADAFAWAYQATGNGDGSLHLKVWNPLDGRFHEVDTRQWRYFLDEDSAPALAAAGNDVLQFPLHAGARVLFKAPPDADHAKLVVRAPNFDPVQGTLEANIYDYYGVKSVRFLPKGNATGAQAMAPNALTGTGADFKLDLGAKYLRTGHEAIEVTNQIGQTRIVKLPGVTTTADTSFTPDFTKLAYDLVQGRAVQTNDVTDFQYVKAPLVKVLGHWKAPEGQYMNLGAMTLEQFQGLGFDALRQKALNGFPDNTFLMMAPDRTPQAFLVYTRGRYLSKVHLDFKLTGVFNGHYTMRIVTYDLGWSEAVTP